MASPWGEGFSPNRCLQNNDCFVPKPLRFKCLRILPLFCVICARRKNASAFSALLVVIPSVSEESPHFLVIPSVSEESPGKDYQQISSRPLGRLFLSPPFLTIHLLIVVIAIMAILAAVLVPTVTNKVKDANAASQATTAENIAKTISLYLAETSEPKVSTLKTYLKDAGYAIDDTPTANKTITITANKTKYDLTCTADVAAIGTTAAQKGKTVIEYKDAKGKSNSSTVMGGIDPEE